jgi:mitogen-activated protein kinase kinase
MGSGRHSAVQATISSTLAKLDMVKFDLRDADLHSMEELGQGNGGSVMKVEHVPSGTIMAKKVGY